MKKRQDAEKEALKKIQPQLDTNLPKKQSELNGITQEGFEGALKRASQKISSPDEEKKET